MKVLLLHPEDRADAGPWSQQHWDLVVDLAFAGPSTYAEWSQTLKCRVITLHQFAGQTESYRWIGKMLERGRGRLLDRFGLDWWELLAVFSFHEMHAFYLLQQLKGELDPASIQLFATRPHRNAVLLGESLACPVIYLQKQRNETSTQLARKVEAVRRFGIRQLLEIASDKWDAGYELRGQFLRHRRAKLKAPALLLPSAYSNVTRTVVQYANLFPERTFLLAATRSNATSIALPDNVQSVPLGAYATLSKQSDQEIADLKGAWESFRTNVLGQCEELDQMSRAGVWDSLPKWLGTGIRVRDAWQELIEREPIEGVLCADDLNVMTRLPVLLANRAGLHTAHTHHGALDGGFLFKKAYARVHLVKGEMERDYLAATEAVDEESIVVAAPAPIPAATTRNTGAGDLVFFSQPCEVDGGRMLEIYRELLPRLCAVGRRVQRSVIVKLHPFESERERRRIVDQVLSPDNRALVKIVTAPASDVMRHTWAGVGLDSTVAIECVLQGIPYFVCGWLDFTGIGYARQFARYGAGILLNEPSELAGIPDHVSNYAPDWDRVNLLSHFPGKAKVHDALFGTVPVSESANSEVRQCV